MKSTVLKKILKSKKNWIAHRKKVQPLASFLKSIIKTNKSLNTALKLIRPSFILEIKRASPSLGIIRKNFDIIDIVNVYNKYASVISVLTDSEYFKGCFEYLPIVRSNSNLPILCKDFIIDPYQIYLSRYYQADGILLMLSVLNDNEYIYLSSIAKSMNMDIITEVNNKEELKRAILLQSTIIGINNRNLNDLSIDMNKTKLMSRIIPRNHTIISESGFSDYVSVRKFSKLVNGFLIGSFLMKESNLEVAVKKIIFGKNKICGLTKQEDSNVSQNAGSIYGGIIFVRSSPRYVSYNIAKEIIKISNLKYIGIFVHEEINLIVYYAIHLNLYAVQLHGEENQFYVNKLRKKLPKNIHIWKAFNIKNAIPLCNFNNVQNYVYDNYKGGSGQIFNWNLINRKIPRNVILAGGLNLNNCVQASYLGFSGLDFNSGVEFHPGKKDPKKIFKIFKKLRYC